MHLTNNMNSRLAPMLSYFRLYIVSERKRFPFLQNLFKSFFRKSVAFYAKSFHVRWEGL